MKGGISTIMNLRDRIGYDAGGTRLEDALAWARSQTKTSEVTTER